MSDIKFETINGMLCRMVEPEPIFGSTKAPFVIVGKNTKHPTIITQDMDILLRIFLVAYSDEFEIIGYPVEEGSREWALYRLMQGDIVIGAYWGDDVMVTSTSSGWHEVIRLNLYGNRHGIPITDSDFLFHAEKMGWQIHEPEPEPAKEQFEVGDWVEFVDAGGRKSQGKYLSNAYDNSILVLDITCNMRCVVPTTKIIRKLDPSEVHVRITLEGQITKPVDNAGGRFWLYYSTDEYVSIELDALSHKDRELVESLLKAQESENV